MTQTINFGRTADGVDVDRITLSCGELTVSVLTLGASLHDLRLAGVPYPLTLGANSVAAYEGPMKYFGAIVGPVANRIGGANALIDGALRQFDPNENGTVLHGGAGGTDTRVWDIVALQSERVVLGLDLPDGWGGFPGARRIRAEFALSGAATLTLTLTAKTDRRTLINLANHSYWNLDGGATFAGHTLRVAAEQYLPVNDRTLPTGTIAPVAGTYFDLRTGPELGATSQTPFDHNLCLSHARRALTFAGELRGASGVSMTLETTEPGLQIYDGRGIDTAPHIGLKGAPYGPYAGLALETQAWPDAPNHAEFPSIELDAGQTYQSITRYGFSRS